MFSVILHFYEFVFDFHPETITSILIGGWPILILVGFLFLSKRNPFTPLTALLLLGIFLPVVLGFVASQFMPLFLSRYFIIVTPLLFILITWFVSELPAKSRFAVGSIFLLSLPVLLVNQLIDPRVPTRENYREAVQYVLTDAGPRDIVVVNPPYLLYPAQYYYHGDTTLATYPIWDKRKGSIPAVTDSLLERDLQTIKAGHRRIYMLTSLDLFGALESKNFLDKHLTRIEKRQFSKNIWVFVYQSEYPAKVDEKEVAN